SWMWRRSSRRWTVIPAAPASSAKVAARTGSGSSPPRAWRSVATWSTLTLSSAFTVSPAAAPRSQDQLRGGHDLDSLLGHLRPLRLEDAERKRAGPETHHERPALPREGDELPEPGAHADDRRGGHVERPAQGQRLHAHILAHLLDQRRAGAVRVDEEEIPPLHFAQHRAHHVRVVHGRASHAGDDS